MAGIGAPVDRIEAKLELAPKICMT